MPYRGHVEKGVIVLDDPAELEDGTCVRVEVAAEQGKGKDLSLAQRLASVIGKAQGLPDDWSEHHDAYLRDAHRE